MNTPRPRAVSGMRPTGALHLGHYHGALKNWLALQQTHDCFFFVADWHALAGGTPASAALDGPVYDMVVDWLACGIDPDRATLFIQSRMPEHAELFTLLAMTTPLPWLERTPAVREWREASATPPTYGFVGYSLLQAADILIYRADVVPVGEDQAPHVALARDVAQRFNQGLGAPVLTEPQVALTDKAQLLGLDGRKMSKSLANGIAMRDAPEVVAAKVRQMLTDAPHARRSPVGESAHSPVWTLYDAYVPQAEQGALAQGRRCADADGANCQDQLIDAIVRQQAPWRERAQALLDSPKQVHWLVEAGTERARTVARQTMKDVRTAMGLVY